MTDRPIDVLTENSLQFQIILVVSVCTYRQQATFEMGRNVVEHGDEKTDKSSEKDTINESDSNSDSDLDEEEFIVERVVNMRTTKKGKVQCKHLSPLLFLCQHCVDSTSVLQIY